MDIVKLQPATKNYLWGGENLRTWGKNAPAGPLAECWELSFNPDSPSLIASGPEKGRPLFEVAGSSDIGPLAASFPFFPVLIKLIDSAKPLSVQVHPSDDYALSHEGQYGKTEMWRIISAAKGAGIYLGFSHVTNLEEVKTALNDGAILDILNFYPVKAGDSFFIPSGTIHAIGAGITLLEIQQNSTLTYRLYDYDRVDKDGKKRELHIEKALHVIDFSRYRPKKFSFPLVGECKYFSSSEKSSSGVSEIKAGDSSFLSFTVLSGRGSFADIPFSRGDTFFVPASKRGTMEGDGIIYIQTEVKAL